MTYESIGQLDTQPFPFPLFGDVDSVDASVQLISS